MSPSTLKTKWAAQEIRRHLGQNGGIGFVFHGTDWETLSFAYEHLSVVPENVWLLPPFIGSPIFFQNRVVGAHICLPPIPSVWAGSHTGIRRFRERAFEPGLRLAHEAGLTHLGLGALVPYATELGTYGRDISSAVRTTGHAATVATIWQQVESFGSLFDFAPASLSYAVIGAAGSIGSNVARWFCCKGARRLVLVDLPNKRNQLAALCGELAKNWPETEVAVRSSSELDSLPTFDLGIIATSASVPWIPPSLLSKAPIWIDDSHPRAASPETETAVAESTLYLECFLRGPQGLCQAFPFRLPTSRDCYSCFAEAFISWQRQLKHDFIVGPVTIAQVAAVDERLKEHGFVAGPPTSKGGKEIAYERLKSLAGVYA